MMNCLEFRWEKLAEPRRPSPEAQAHASGCPACAGFAREVDASERALERVLAVRVPEGLAERVILQARGRHPAWRAWALAATVVLAVALGFLYFDEPKQRAEYARLAIEHVAMEPQSLSVVHDADPQAFRAVIQNLGGSVKDMPGKIRYMRLCPFADGFAWHLVIETPEGLATLFLVPGKKPAEMQAASVGSWSAVVHPTQRGYYAIVTASSSTTSRFARMLRDCIIWNA